MSDLNYPVPEVESFFPMPVYQPGQPLFFMHIRKCAGTSVRLTMENYFHGRETFPSGIPILGKGYINANRVESDDLDLNRFVAVSGHGAGRYLARMKPEFKVFTWVRPPRDWLISDFFFTLGQEVSSNAFLDVYRQRLRSGERKETVYMDWMRARANGQPRLLGDILGYARHTDIQKWMLTNSVDQIPRQAERILKRCFFIGLQPHQELSLDGLSALTGILPPRQDIRRNVGIRRKQLELSPEESREHDELVRPDEEWYAVLEQVHLRHMAQLRERAETEEIFRYIGDREGMRNYILKRAAAQGRLDLRTWDAWDPVYGENLDGRERMFDESPEERRWRWTSPHPETHLNFRLPRDQSYLVRLRLNTATPPENTQGVTLKLSSHPVPLRLRDLPEGGFTLEGVLGRSLLESLPEITELCLHTPYMLDELSHAKDRLDFRGTRTLGIALEEIRLEPLVA